MTNEDKVNQIMAEVELFMAMYKVSPMGGGITTTTYRFNCHDAPKQFPSLEPKYNKVKQLAEQFPFYFDQFVKEADFVNKWNKMTTEEQNYIVFFDDSSYPILRQVLPAEKIHSVNWSEVMNNITIEMNPELLEKLGLPAELINPPFNKLEELKAKRKLVSLGYEESEAEALFEANRTAKSYEGDKYSKALFNLGIKNKNQAQLDEIMEQKGIDIPWYAKYELNFFSDQEKVFQNSGKNKPKI